MVKYDLESLRTEMIQAFHNFAATDRNNMAARINAWEFYCDAREMFLQADCFRYGIKYLRLKETLITNYIPTIK